MSERPIENSGVVLTRVRVPDVARDFSPRANLRYPYQPRARSHASSVRTLKIPTLAAMLLLGPTKTLQTLTGTGSAALAAAVTNPGKATRISRKGKRNRPTKNLLLKFQHYF